MMDMMDMMETGRDDGNDGGESEEKPSISWKGERRKSYYFKNARLGRKSIFNSYLKVK